MRIELLTGIVKGKKRKEVTDGLIDGSIHIVVGTHAIIEDKIQFNNLGLAVIDEQHRFGVEQRASVATEGYVSSRAYHDGYTDSSNHDIICVW